MSSTYFIVGAQTAEYLEQLMHEADLEEFIEHAEEVKTDEEIKEDVHRMMDSYLEDYLGI